MSIFVLGLAITLAGAGTWASLTDTGKSTGNSFSTGTLDMRMADDNEAYSDSVTGTWKSPTNFKPGDTFNDELRFTNVGSININHLYLYPEDLTNTGGKNNVKLSDKIYITTVTGHITRDGADIKWGNRAGAIALLIGDHRSPLTLTEFCGSKYVAYYIQPIVYTVFQPILKGNDHKDWGLIIEGNFANDADNNYQGSSCTFNMRCVGSQDSPTEGFEEITGEGPSEE